MLFTPEEIQRLSDLVIRASANIPEQHWATSMICRLRVFCAQPLVVTATEAVVEDVEVEAETLIERMKKLRMQRNYIADSTCSVPMKATLL